MTTNQLLAVGICVVACSLGACAEAESPVAVPPAQNPPESVPPPQCDAAYLLARFDHYVGRFIHFRPHHVSVEIHRSGSVERPLDEAVLGRLGDSVVEVWGMPGGLDVEFLLKIPRAPVGSVVSGGEIIRDSSWLDLIGFGGEGAEFSCAVVSRMTEIDNVDKTFSGGFAAVVRERRRHKDLIRGGYYWTTSTPYVVVGVFTDIPIAPRPRMHATIKQESSGKVWVCDSVVDVSAATGYSDNARATLAGREFSERFAVSIELDKPLTIGPRAVGPNDLYLMLDETMAPSDRRMCRPDTVDSASTIVITSIDTLRRTVSGTFRFRGSTDDRARYQIDDGTFADLPRW